MKEEWNVKRLGDICKIITGRTPSTTVKEYWGNDYLWLTPAEMGNLICPYISDTKRKLSAIGLDKCSIRLAPAYSVILSSRAPIGYLAINTKPMSTNQGCKSLVPLDMINYKFLYYYILYKKPYIVSLGEGATFPEITETKLENVGISFPNIVEQERIVGILDTYFEVLNQTIQETEKNLIRVDDLNESVLNRIFNEKGKGRQEIKLDKICYFENGYKGKNYPSKFYRKKEGIPFINAGHLVENKIDFSSMDYINIDTFNKLKSGKIQPNDILFCLRGSLGKYATVENLAKGTIASSLVIIRCNKDILNKFFMYYLKSNFCKQMIFKFSNGTVIPHLSVTSLKQFKIYLPSISEQNEIVNYLDELFLYSNQLKHIYYNKVKLVEELIQSLLNQAFTANL
jgi:type I restriction enzyme S subunit